MISKSIIFYAPMGNGIPSELIGGGEVGCRRTYEILKSAGYKVFLINKAVMSKGAAGYLLGAIRGYFHLLYHLLKEKDSILYIVGFYEKNIYIERLFEITGCLTKHKIIYEARNGRLVAAYQERGKHYKKVMKSVLKDADKVFCQGVEYLDFIDSLVGNKGVYTPNYIMDRYIKGNNQRSMDTLNILYFGRITEQKNINIIIEIYNVLKRRGISSNLTIIGNYTQPYKTLLDSHIRELGLENDDIRFTGRKSFDEISKILGEYHFFLFPTNEQKEGHSNSLTEAMAFGVVPVASPLGFNRRIIDTPELIVNDYTPEHYADVIEDIWKSGTWKKYSEKMYSTTLKNYTETVVKNALLTTLNLI